MTPMVKQQSNLLERLVPILLLASIVLAFVVGVLWQKVNNLESGSKVSGSNNAAAADTTGSNNGQPAADTTSKLTDLEGLVGGLGIDLDKYKSCVEADKYKDRIESDLQKGIEAGVQGTPGNFVMNQKGDVWFIPGAFPYESIKPVIDLAMGKGGDATLAQGIEKLTSDKAAKLEKLKDSDHIRGNRNAQVLLIEYSDFECPFCIRFHPTAQQLKDEYGNDLAWVYRHYPLDQLHPYARPAAVASECVTEIGGEEAFWKFADEVFSS